MTAKLTCRCGIDTHAHVVPENFPRYLGSAVPADWPSMAPAQACHRSVMISDKAPAACQYTALPQFS